MKIMVLGREIFLELVFWGGIFLFCTGVDTQPSNISLATRSIPKSYEACLGLFLGQTLKTGKSLSWPLAHSVVVLCLTRAWEGGTYPCRLGALGESQCCSAYVTASKHRSMVGGCYSNMKAGDTACFHLSLKSDSLPRAQPCGLQGTDILCKQNQSLSMAMWPFMAEGPNQCQLKLLRT